MPTPEPDPLARPSWRGRTNVDALTISCIERAEEMGTHEFIVTQGSYQSTVSASAGTHDKGGAVDLRWCGHDKCILNLRKAGMAAWHRRPSQGPWPDHIHAVVVNHPLLAPSAARQVVSYRAGRNGLANNGADDGPRLNPIPTPIWPWPEEDPMADYAKQLDRIEQKIDADRAEQREFRAEYRERSVRQRQAVMERLRELKKLSAQELAAIEALMPADES